MANLDKNKLVLVQESTFGVKAPDTNSIIVRRTGSSIEANRDYFGSKTIREDRQTMAGDFGVEKVDGDIEMELANKHASLLFQGLLGSTFADKTSPAAGTITIGAPSNGISAVTLGQGFSSLMSGDIVRFTGLTATALNGVNMMITSVTSSTVFSIASISTDVVLVGTSAASGTVDYVGKGASIGQSSYSFTIEDGYIDIAKYGIFTGVKVQSADISLTPNSLIGMNFKLIGKQLLDINSTTSYPLATAIDPSIRSFTSTFGAIRVGSTLLGAITSSSISISRNLTPSENILNGSTVSGGISEGIYTITGKIATELNDPYFYTLFKSEAPVEINLVYTNNKGGTADFIAITLPSAIIKAPKKSIDGDRIIIEAEFEAHVSSGKSSIYIQDSLL